MIEVANAIEELSRQREFLLRNKWVPGDPRLGTEPQGCLIMAVDEHRRLDGLASAIAVRAMEWTMAQMGYPSRNVVINNDEYLKSAGEAIEVLERSIQNIKEAFGEGGE